METTLTPIIAAELPADEAELCERLRQLRAWKHGNIGVIKADAMGIGADNYKASRLNAFDDLDKRLKALAEAVSERGLAKAAKALLVEIAATRNEIKAAVDERKAVIRDFKDRLDPKGEQFEFLIEVRCEPKTYEAICKRLDKDGVAYRARRVKDGESAAIETLVTGKEAK